jgi:two-component system NtrC family sensor kinase
VGIFGNKIGNTLAGKLTFAIFALMFAGSTISASMFFLYEKNVTLRNLTEHAQFVSDLIKSSLHQDMLRGEREDVSVAIQSIGKVKDVKNVFIYNREGIAVYASDDTLIGTAPERENLVQAALNGRTVRPLVTKDYRNMPVLLYYSAIVNDKTCYTAACHFHSRDDRVLGVLVTSLSASSIKSASNQIVGGAIFIGGILVATLSVFLFFIINKFVTRPIILLEQGVKRLADGEFADPIIFNSRDELGLLAENFNITASQIQRYRSKLENWARELEDEVAKKTVEIKQAQEQLSNAEKLASLGRLSAGVAHELNNPLTGIVTFAHLMRDRMPKENELDREDLDMIIEQANRCTKIVKGLLSFSRKGTSEKALINLNEIIEGAIGLLKNQSAFHDIQMDLKLHDGLPLIYVDANQIHQVILNLFTNATDAMNNIGLIKVSTQTVLIDGLDYVEMSFSDTGPGIGPEHMNKIFEPFFTTKDVGKGTGLGLPVSYGIIKRHGGDILVQSKINKGATFFVRLPVQKDDPEQDVTEQEG